MTTTTMNSMATMKTRKGREIKIKTKTCTGYSIFVSLSSLFSGFPLSDPMIPSHAELLDSTNYK